MKVLAKFGDVKFLEGDLVSYWSVYNQTWVKGSLGIPDQELAALDPSTRDKVVGYMKKNGMIEEQPSWVDDYLE